MSVWHDPYRERDHRIRWTDEGGFCDAGEDCPVCEAMADDDDETDTDTDD